MIIWGSKSKIKTVGQGNFFCPNCRRDARYSHLRVVRYFTLYFIPLFPTATLGEGIQCNACRAEFNMNILRLSKDQILFALQPWVCGKCQNHNPPSTDSCLACGFAKGAAPPAPLPPAGGEGHPRPLPPGYQ